LVNKGGQFKEWKNRSAFRSSAKPATQHGEGGRKIKLLQGVAGDCSGKREGRGEGRARNECSTDHHSTRQSEKKSRKLGVLTPRRAPSFARWPPRGCEKNPSSHNCKDICLHGKKPRGGTNGKNRDVENATTPGPKKEKGQKGVEWGWHNIKSKIRTAQPECAPLFGKAVNEGGPSPKAQGEKIPKRKNKRKAGRYKPKNPNPGGRVKAIQRCPVGRPPSTYLQTRCNMHLGGRNPTLEKPPQ